MMGSAFWAILVMAVILYLMIVILGVMRRSQNRNSYRESLLRDRDRDLDRFDNSKSSRE
jgi:hypothetical protein